MFEKASRLKLRFDTPMGQLSVEDLWDLPLTASPSRVDLDKIALALDREIAVAGTKSFVVENKKNEALELKFEIVKHVIKVRLEEKRAAAEVAEKREKKERLLEIIARKQDKALEDTPLEDLQKMVEAL